MPHHFYQTWPSLTCNLPQVLTEGASLCARLGANGTPTCPVSRPLGYSRKKGTNNLDKLFPWPGSLPPPPAGGRQPSGGSGAHVTSAGAQSRPEAGRTWSTSWPCPRTRHSPACPRLSSSHRARGPGWGGGGGNCGAARCRRLAGLRVGSVGRASEELSDAACSRSANGVLLSLPLSLRLGQTHAKR